MQASAFYKLGAARALNHFVDHLGDEDDNPTAPITAHKTAAEAAITRALEKLGKPSGRKIEMGSRKGGVSQSVTTGKGTRFEYLKRKLRKQKNRSS